MSLTLKTRQKKGNRFIALLDGGLITYRCGFACQTKDENGNVVPEPIENCLHTVKLFIQQILNDLDTDHYILFISGDSNFRDEVVDYYKSGRAEKPYHYNNIREYLIKHWNAEVVQGMEEDDAMATAQTEAIDTSQVMSKFLTREDCLKARYGNTCIVTQDKDLLQVPGWNYNPVKKEMKFITPEEGVLNFYCQMLSGDSTDSIKGIKGTGEKPPWPKARKILADCETEREMLCRVGLMYAIHFDDPEGMMWTNAALLYMKRTPLGTFQPGEEIMRKLYEQT